MSFQMKAWESWLKGSLPTWATAIAIAVATHHVVRLEATLEHVVELVHDQSQKLAVLENKSENMKEELSMLRKLKLQNQ